MFLSRIKLALGVAIFAFSSMTYAQKFKVVLDPGHGGKDFGAVRNGFVEKKIVLDVAKRVGELIAKDRNIEVVYTRSTDDFVELRRRCEIANQAKGNVFVSIHANAAKNTEAYGTETFVIGSSKTASNLEVAKRENDAITLEDDYKTSYTGFDPSKPESLLGLTLMQEEYISQSIDLASKVQSRFTNDLKRRNRGVKQGPFWVLHGAFMPSVLIELGFLSNEEEGEYVNSNEGKEELSRAIAGAILEYKRNYYGGEGTTVLQDRTSNTSTPAPKQRGVVRSAKVELPKEEVAQTSSIQNIGKEQQTKEGVYFMIEIARSDKDIDTKPSNFKGLKNITKEKIKERDSKGEKIVYKYYYNKTTDINHAKKALEEAKNHYPSSFLVAYKNDKKVSLAEALK